MKGRVLVTGGFGVLGRRLCLGLAEAGWRVRILGLHGDPQAEETLRGFEAQGLAPPELFFGDVTDRKSLAGCAEGADVVHHLAAVILAGNDPSPYRRVNLDGTRNMLAEAARAGVRHFIFISSASVTYGSPNPYSQSKAEAEKAVREAGLPAFTVVRPTLLYEKGGSLEYQRFVEYLERYPVVPLLGPGTARKRPVYAPDLLPPLIAMAANPKAFGKTYNLSGGESLSLREMIGLILASRGKRRKILPLPVWFCRLLLPLFGGWARLRGRSTLLNRQTLTGMLEDADLDPGEAMRDLGYAPRSFSEGLKLLSESP